MAAYTNANGLPKKSFTDVVNLVDLCNGNVGRGSQISFPLTVIGQKLENSSRQVSESKRPRNRLVQPSNKTNVKHRHVAREGCINRRGLCLREREHGANSKTKWNRIDKTHFPPPLTKNPRHAQSHLIIQDSDRKCG